MCIRSLGCPPRAPDIWCGSAGFGEMCDGSDPPPPPHRDKAINLCPLCDTYHGAQLCRMQCPTWNSQFLKVWPGNRGDWTDYATDWYDHAIPDDHVHVSRLCIPQSFVEGLPKSLQPALHEREVYHQYHSLLSGTSHRGELPMPPRYTDPLVPSQSISAWFGSLRPRKVKPIPTPKNLREQGHFSPPQMGVTPQMASDNYASTANPAAAYCRISLNYGSGGPC